MKTAEDVIKFLNLKPLPEEGGYFRETYRSDKINAPAKIFGINSDSPRVISTAIYYLVHQKSFSALHRIKSDEVFHFYAGDPVEMIQINDQGILNKYILGADVFKEQQPQVVVPKGVWQALRLKEGGSWALLGTTVSPGFEFEDFEVGTREQMLKLFPQHRDDIMRFSRSVNEKAH
ncbi:MAG: cupin domain-containing protein [Oligoflexia bacterium]|nr:cupin domain-containing protein [Oligoflexia bacterium]